MLLLETCTKMTGDGIFTTQSKEQTGLEIKMQFITWFERRQRQS